ncbi:MAG: RidA family protein [Pleurocapsa sp. MO_226.B13]|nr:RidA family protein [Pleurocapsa sp. MO_226.B13]
MKDTSDYGFTQAVVVPSGTELAYIAGQGGADENGNYGSFSEQMERAFASLDKALRAVGATPEDVVKITILSVEHNEEKLKLISAKRRSFWSDHKPASTLIPVPRLASDGMLFEIDAIAVVSRE